MSTLGAMITAIQQETRRNDADWPDRCRSEIERAVQHYQRERFWFNQTREITFNTVAAREFYDGTDHADIPNLLAISYATVRRGTELYELCLTTARDLDTLSLSDPQQMPIWYSYFESKLRLWPIPDEIYPVRINALIRAPFPASDAEADNHWMTDAEELIRSRAKRNLYLHHMGSRQRAEDMRAAEEEALASLRAETSRRTNVHRFAPAEVY